MRSEKRFARRVRAGRQHVNTSVSPLRRTLRRAAGATLLSGGLGLGSVAFLSGGLPGWMVMNTVEALNNGAPFEQALPAARALLAGGSIQPVEPFVVYAEFLAGALLSYLGVFALVNARQPGALWRLPLQGRYWREFQRGLSYRRVRRRV